MVKTQCLYTIAMIVLLWNAPSLKSIWNSLFHENKEIPKNDDEIFCLKMVFQPKNILRITLFYIPQNKL